MGSGFETKTEKPKLEFAKIGKGFGKQRPKILAHIFCTQKNRFFLADSKQQQQQQQQ
jgi:hypothetical protein